MSGFARVLEAAGYYSRARSNELRDQLDALADALGWNGVVSGLEVVDNGGVSVSIAAGSLLSNGVLHEETTATTYNGLPSDGTSTLFLRAARTANPDPLDQTTLDTYDLETDDNTTGLLPAEDVGWFPRAVVVTSGGDILSITHLNATPPGVGLLPAVPNVIRPHQTAIVPEDTQVVIYEELSVEGTLIIAGDLRIRGDD